MTEVIGVTGVRLDVVRVGVRFRKPYPLFEGKLYHVRAIVDGDQVVIRSWSKRRRMWMYQVEWIETVARWIEEGQRKPEGIMP